MGNYRFYAVKKGHIPGIYTSWSEAQKQIKGFPNQEYKGFYTEEDASKFLYDAVSEYKNLEKLGEGGFATVYMTSDFSKPIVVKVLKKELVDDQGVVSRFHREYEITKSLLDIDGVVKVYEFSETNLSYTMEYLDTTLAKYINQNKDNLDIPEKVNIILQIVSTIEKVHERGILHRDITPRNIFLNNGVVKIADFGLGKDLNSLTSHETMYTRNFGVFDYCSPEQYEQLKDATKQSDIYSLGKVINYIMTGSPSNTQHIFKSVVENCTTREPERRYIDCEPIINSVKEIYKYSLEKSTETLADLDLRDGNLTVLVQNYLQDASGETICQKLSDKNYFNFDKLLIKYMTISEDNSHQIIDKISKSFQDFCGFSFAANDVFADFSYLVVSSDFSQIVKDNAVSILNYIAWGVNRFHAQDLVKELIRNNQGVEQYMTRQRLESKSWDNLG